MVGNKRYQEWVNGINSFDFQPSQMKIVFDCWMFSTRIRRMGHYLMDKTV